MVPNHLLDFNFWHILVDILDKRLLYRRFLLGRYLVFGNSLIVMAFQFIKKFISWGRSMAILYLFHQISKIRSSFRIDIFDWKALGHISCYLLNIGSALAIVTFCNLDHLFIRNFIYFTVLEEAGTAFDNFFLLVKCIGSTALSIHICIHNHLSLS